MVDMIGQPVSARIDRPLGSAHPRHPKLVYRLNYGFVPGTRALDGGEFDIYVMGVAERLENFDGCCIAVIHRLDDVEDKLVAAPFGSAFSSADILEQTHFQERFFRSRLITARTDLDGTFG